MESNQEKNKFEFTEKQNEILSDSSKKLLVSASAGSGKTATIIEKIFRLVVEGVDLQKMLIITFTDASSLEMKMRLKDSLRKYAATSKILREQLEKLPNCDISTLHSFCSKMIRKYFYYLDLKPNFSVLDELSSKFLKSLALEKVIKEFSQNDDIDFVNLCSIFSGGRNFESLKSSILKYYDFLCGIQDKDEFNLKIALSCYNENLESNVAVNFLNEYAVNNLQYFYRQFEEKKKIAIQDNAQIFIEFIDNVLKNLNYINIKNSFIQNQQYIKNLTLPRFPTKKLSDGESNFKLIFKPFWEMFTSRLGEIKKYLTDKCENEIIQDLKNARKFLEKFIEVENLYEKYYLDFKIKRNGLDFNDLEILFLKLLEIEQVRNELKYEYIFIDEYQDINCVQEKILNTLSKNSKIVMVGDIKQSIYAFRNSTPEIFTQKLEKYSKDASSGKLINLNQNFRSNPIILEFVNKIFINCMSSNFGGVDYKKIGQLEGSVEYQTVSDIPIVEVDIIDTQDEQEENLCKYPNVYSVADDENEYSFFLSESRKEAMIVADKILSIIGKSYFDNKKKEIKKISFKDIAILSRSNDFLKEIANVLLEYKVPIETNLIDNFYENKDVFLIYSMLRLLNNFHDDNALCVVLSSYFFGLSFDELAKIRQLNIDEKFFYNCLNSYFTNASKDDLIYQKLLKFFKFFESLQDKLLYDSLFEILNFIVDYFDYFDYLLSLPDGFNRQKIVKDFLNTFINSEYNYDLVGYLNYVDNFAFDSVFKTSLVGSVDSVKLGTIHSSKGLEYPIIFLVGCGRDFSKQTFKEDLLKDKDYGLGMYSFDLEKHEKSSNIARNMITIFKRRQERAEELRLLYVALTRARNHLFVIGDCNLSKVKQIVNLEDAQAQNDYLSWILTSLSSVNFVNLTQNKKDLCQRLDKGSVDFKIFSKDFFVLSNKENLVYNAKNLDKNIVTKLKKLFDYNYKSYENIALKNSVSSLLKEHGDSIESFNFEPKKLSIFETSSTSDFYSRLGTAYHNIMQEIDFNKEFNLVTFKSILISLKLDDDLVSKISFNKIDRCVNTIKEFNIVNVKKEVPFLSYLPYNQVFDSNIEDKILIQGVADLLVETKDKKFIVDYKITKTQNETQLINKYKVQLALYKTCLERASNDRLDAAYIYSFYFDKILKVF